MSLEANVRTRQLKARQMKIKIKIEHLSKECKETQRKLAQAQTQLASIENQIEDLSKQEPRVTEHAVIRYVEKILKIDTTEICSKILTDEIKEQIKTCGSGKYLLVDDHYIVVKNADVVSII